MVAPTKPYPYQRRGVKKVHYQFDGRALIADEMGLGKTPQALWYVDWFLERGPVLIICPANMKETWRREARKHTGMRVEILGSHKPPKGFKLNPARLYVINYDVLVSWVKVLRRRLPQLVITDESQMIKSPGAKRTKAWQAICNGVPKILCLTGTPIENCPAEFWTTLHTLRPDVFNSHRAFLFRYCDPKRKFWGWEFKGATNLEELHELAKATCMIRRLKKNVLRQLPPKTRIVQPVDISKPTEYREAEKEFIKWLMKKSKKRALRAMNAEAVVKLGYLKRLAGVLKFKAVVAWLDEFLKTTGEKIIIFGIHKKLLKALKSRYKEQAVLVTGSTSLKNRQIAMDRFNKSKSCRIFIGNLIAAGVGWSCSSASTVAFIELDWVPGKHTQAEDRIHGLGRGVAGRKAMIYYLVARGTIEEMLCRVLQEKQLILDRTLDGKVVTRLDVLDQLTAGYLKKKRAA